MQMLYSRCDHLCGDRDQVDLGAADWDIGGLVGADLSHQRWAAGVPQVAREPADELGVVPLQSIVVEVKSVAVLGTGDGDGGRGEGLVWAVLDSERPFVITELELGLVDVTSGVQAGDSGVALVGNEGSGAQTGTSVVAREVQVLLA